VAALGKYSTLSGLHRLNPFRKQGMQAGLKLSSLTEAKASESGGSTVKKIEGIGARFRLLAPNH
jgi:hypothetical protein